MSTQQDIYAAGSENRPPMLNKDNYVPWSSRIIRYARSRPNGKMIVDSFENGPYVRRMVTTPGEPDLSVPVPETFHEQTDEELTENDIRRMNADDQAIQTILLGLPEDVHWGTEKKAKLFNEWEKFTSTDGESIESYYHRFMQLMNDLKRNKHFPENIAANLKFLNNLQPEWKRHVTIVRQTKNLHEADFTQIYDFLKMNQDEVNELRAERLAKTHDPLALMAHSQNPYNFPATHNDQSSSSTHSQQSFPINNKYNPQPSFNQNFMQPPMTSLEDINDPNEAMNATLILFAKAFQLTTPTNNNQRTSSNPRNCQIAQPVVPGIANQNGTGNIVAARAEGTRNGNQQPSTSGTQLDKAPVYDTDGSAEVQHNDNCYDNDIFNMFTQEEQYTDLLEPIPEPQLVPQNDNNVTSVSPSMVQSGSTVESSSAPNEETHAHQETVYCNLIDQVAQVNMVNRNMRATNAELKSELARYKIQEQRMEISQDKYDKLEKCYQESVYQEQCLTRKINALHLSSAKQITTLNDEISNLNKQLSKEKSTISSLMEEKKRLKHDFKTREDKDLDREVDLEAKIKELENILLKRDQTVQTMHMLNPNLDLFYHQDQKIASGYPNPLYLKQAQLKQQSLYDGNLLLKKHDPPAVYVSEETLELAQESREKMRFLKKEIKPVNYAKINHLSGVFIPQTTKSKEELFLSNVSNMVTISKTISIPNEDLSDDTTPSVARKFLNEVKNSLVTLQRVVKQKMTLEVHNWSSSTHKEVHKIISYEIAPIINQVDARVQNFEIQFLKEAAKFVRDFKSLAKEADESLDKQKYLELEIERLLKASVIHDIMSIVQNSFVDVPSNLQTELDRTNEKLENYIIKKENEYAKLWNDWYQKCEECKYDKISYHKAYKDMQYQIERLQAQLGDLKGKRSITPSASNTLLRAHVFEKTSESMNNTSGTSVTPQVDKPKLSVVTPFPKKLHASILTNPITNSQHHVTFKEHVSSDTVNSSSTGLVHTARTRLPPPQRCEAILIPVVVQICLWCVDSGCSKHMTGNIKLLINFVWKFLGTVRFGNDHIAAILGYGDLKWGNITIARVYFVEGLGHNLFSVGQFCDADLEVAFRRNTCFIRDLDGVDLLKGNRTTNLYTINLYDMASASPICLMARATPTKSWLWHQRLSHLNFDTINDLAKNDLVSGLPKFKYAKEHLCPSCEQGKSKRASHPPKPVPNSKQRLHLLHMDLCGPMRVASINAEVIKNFLKNIYVCLQAPVIIVRTDNGTKFKNLALKEHFDSVVITHEKFCLQKLLSKMEVVERYKNRTLVEACQNYVDSFSLLRCPMAVMQLLLNVREDISKLGAKGDIGFFIGYSANYVAYRVYNQRTKKIMETMNVNSSGLELTYAPSTITPQKPSERNLDILFEPLHNEYLGGQPSEAPRTVPAAPVIQNLQVPTASITIQDSAPTPTNSSNTLNSSHNVDEQSQHHAQQQGNHTLLPTASAADNVPNAVFEGDLFINPFATPSIDSAESSTQNVDPSNMHTFYQSYPYDYQ
ncbi:retrovirus-related pol polyprotein from transposon TNT 1-94 [Tanacetum coccineum]